MCIRDRFTSIDNLTQGVFNLFSKPGKVKVVEPGFENRLKTPCVKLSIDVNNPVLAVTSEAVSYTHLDVYKRQHPKYPKGYRWQNQRQHQKAASSHYSCLLYTSRCV